MIIVEHRKNLSSDLRLVPDEHGVEIDLRLSHGELVLAHDPHAPGQKFDEWISEYHHALLILNVKEEGLESIILEKLQRNKVFNYFFLDQAVPSIIKSIKLRHSVAARISEYEDFTWATDMAPSWIWADSFTGNWNYLDPILEKITRLKLKTCFVSPELQGRFESAEMRTLKSILQNHKFTPDAVCTKDPSIWES